MITSQDAQQISRQLSDLSSSLASSDGGPVLVATLKSVEIVFFFLNSIQLTALPILLNITLPAHVYESLRVMSQFVFISVPGWN